MCDEYNYRDGAENDNCQCRLYWFYHVS